MKMDRIEAMGHGKWLIYANRKELEALGNAVELASTTDHGLAWSPVEGENAAIHVYRVPEGADLDGTNPEREELKRVIDEIADAAKAALDHPRNVEKGGWMNESRHYFADRLAEELGEFLEEMQPASPARPPSQSGLLAEGGDVLNFLAMAVHNLRVHQESQRQGRASRDTLH